MSNLIVFSFLFLCFVVVFTSSTNQSSKTAGFYIQKPAVFFTESISKNLILSIISVFAADFFDAGGLAKTAIY